MMLHMLLSICTFLQNVMALSLSVFELYKKKKKQEQCPNINDIDYEP